MTDNDCVKLLLLLDIVKLWNWF